MTPEQIWTLVLSGIAALAVIGAPFAIWASVMQKRAEKRDLEARDVVWSASRYDAESGWEFTHSGSTDALEVKIDLTIDGRTSTARFERVARDEPVTVEHGWHKELVEEAEAEQRRYERESENFSPEGTIEVPGIIGAPIKVPGFMTNPPPVPPLVYRAEAMFVVNWRSPLGRPDHQERAWTETY